MSEYLFAYGTLQPGLAPKSMAHATAKLRAVGAGFVRGVLYDLGRYPGAIADAGAAGRISGTVMELPDDADVLRALDDYEGFDPHSRESSEFVRERQKVEMANGGTLACWFYRYNGPADDLRRIASGEWRKHRNQIG
jgi:gamma-glutamylcyclotransferase (GGCT)/AIG2-like uncharacterized protein YtfP